MTLPVILEPFRIAYYGGFWYLIGNDTSTGILKRYALDKIGAFRISKEHFKSIPNNLDAMFQRSANIWFGEEENLKVTILVDATCSGYFRRRKMHPSQEIIEDRRQDGSIVASYRVGHLEAIRNILKSWIPHVVILEPDELRKDLLSDVKEWVTRQEGTV